MLIHYHLFKNAGTSIDEMLLDNFGARWTTQEFHAPRHANAASVSEFVRARPELVAISSHTALLPVPKIDGVSAFPIIFIRHPIDRLRSAYEFERKQSANTQGARLAKAQDFAGYLRELLKGGHRRQARNFQTFRLSQNEPARFGTEYERAVRALRQLPFIGLVEDYDASLNRLESLLRPHFHDFRTKKTHRNISRSAGNSLAERLITIEAQLGIELYKEICAANESDMALHTELTKLISLRA